MWLNSNTCFFGKIYNQDHQRFPMKGNNNMGVICLFPPMTETYLEPNQTFTMEFLGENS